MDELWKPVSVSDKKKLFCAKFFSIFLHFLIVLYIFSGSRATTTFRFGYISLDLISIVREDSGEYVCRVTSLSGCAESQALLSVTGTFFIPSGELI
jgi:hypothetical protein